MSGPPPEVAAVRVAVRRCLRGLREDGHTRVVLGVSGGADSMALADAVAFEKGRIGIDAVAIVVDHGLQPDSADVTATVRTRVERIGLACRVVRVNVPDASPDGPEMAARQARHRALQEACDETGAGAILLGHTRDDQAETVLLGLVRGSGLRSLSGIAPVAGRLHRPLLAVTRDQTHAACAARGIDVWHDPHNDDDRYLRVRVRRALADLETELGPGLRAGLARTADLARSDADHLDGLAAATADRLGGPPWRADDLAELAAPVRTRWWRRALTDAGAVGPDISSTHVGWLEGLVLRWHGQGPVDVPGGLKVRRADGQVHVDPR